MLSGSSRHHRPFSFFTCQSALGADDCAMLEALFSARDGWQARDDGFYSCSLRDTTREIPTRLLSGVLARMTALTGLPLAAEVVATAQRLLPGQVIGVHSDHPLLGYEVARLVVQLNRDWTPGHGGVLELYASPDGPPVERIEPVYNSAFGFLLSEKSYHGVTRANAPRRSVVFNFWHEGNTPALADAVRALFADPRFAELPRLLDAVASDAEARLPEAVGFRANLAALALQRWGYDDDAVVDGYRFSAQLAEAPAPATDEIGAAVRMADWVARLYTDPFEIARWAALREALAGVAAFPRLAAIRRVGALAPRGVLGGLTR